MATTKLKGTSKKIKELKGIKPEKITDEQLKKVQDTVNNINRTNLEIGSMEVRGGIRSTEALSGKTADSVNLGRVGWMDGQIVLGINL